MGQLEGSVSWCYHYCSYLLVLLTTLIVSHRCCCFIICCPVHCFSCCNAVFLASLCSKNLVLLHSTNVLTVYSLNFCHIFIWAFWHLTTSGECYIRDKPVSVFPKTSSGGVIRLWGFIQLACYLNLSHQSLLKGHASCPHGLRTLVCRSRNCFPAFVCC